jgi:hypothetical protein
VSTKLFACRTSAVSVAAATTQTIVQAVAADANTPLTLKQLSVSFKDPTSSDTEVLVDLLRQSTAGTSSALTPVSYREQSSAAARFTALQTFTAEPTAGNVLDSWYVLPYGGLFVIQFPIDAEPTCTSRIAVRVTTVASQAQTVSASLLLAE